jgi:hypothetical protein
LFFFLRKRKKDAKIFHYLCDALREPVAQAQTSTPSICNPVQAYFQKHDSTGTLPFKADYTTKLNNAAIKLVQTIPDAQCANFKVYDYGFTPINQYTKGGYAEDFEVMKLEAKGANRDQYYLLFAKEVNANNHVTKIWVDVELPKTGKFSCLSDMQRSLVKIRLEKAVEDNYYENQSVCFAESRGIAFLQQQVKTIVDCCAGEREDCTRECMTSKEVLNFFNDLRFIKFDIKVESQYKVTDFECSQTGTKNSDFRSAIMLENYVNYPIIVAGQSVNLANLILAKTLDKPLGHKIFVMDCNNVKDGTFISKVKELSITQKGIIYFIFNFSDKNYLFVSPSCFELIFLQDQEIFDEINENLKSVNNCDDCPDWVKEVMNPDYSESKEYAEATLANAIVLSPATVVDGPIPIADGIVAAVAATYVATQITFLTYELHNIILDRYYAGRTSGIGITPLSIMKDRLNNNHAHFKNGTISPAKVDRAVQGFPLGYIIIRGREQQLCDFYGGAISDFNLLSPVNKLCPKKSNELIKKTSNNDRPVAKYNPSGYFYWWSSTLGFGELHPYTGCGADNIYDALDKTATKSKAWFKDLKKYYSW